MEGEFLVTVLTLALAQRNRFVYIVNTHVYTLKLKGTQTDFGTGGGLESRAMMCVVKDKRMLLL